MPLAPNSATLMAPYSWYSAPPPIKLADGTKIDRPHIEWTLHQLRWRWLLDSWEGGEAYRNAIYGFDIHGQPIRNLIRHKREYPSDYETTYSPTTGRPPGTDQAAQATDDDYELRRARTPVPTFVSEAIKGHLTKIYKREVVREGPKPLVEFWADVDGQGHDVDCWFQQTVAPLYLTYGCLDFVVDKPAVPEGQQVKTRADEMRLKLDSVVASYILPENMIWWCLGPKGEYAKCLVREPQDSGLAYWRYWDETGWQLFDEQAKPIGSGDHGFGRVPIVRAFDRRRPRYRNVGLPRYEPIAEMQREYYNRDSELILSDTTQAHPLLQGPEDYIQPDGTVPVGPAWLLPKKKNTGGGAATYEGFDVVQFPKDGAESIRQNKLDLRDAVDRAAGLTKPAGAKGSSGQTVSQSGLSKRLDQSDGNDLLIEIAQSLGEAEATLAKLACDVLGLPASRGPGPDDESIDVRYPSQFDLFTADELAESIIEFQAICAQAGAMPEIEGELLKKLVGLMLTGLDDDEYAELYAEIETYLTKAASDRAAAAEAGPNPMLTESLNGGPNVNQPVYPAPKPAAGGKPAPGDQPVGR